MSEIKMLLDLIKINRKTINTMICWNIVLSILVLLALING